MPKLDTLARKSRLIHIADASTPTDLSAGNKVLAVKVRSSTVPYYFFSGMAGKNPTDNPGDFLLTGDTVHGPYPEADDSAGTIGYHEVSDEIGHLWIGGSGAMTVELLCL